MTEEKNEAAAPSTALMLRQNQSVINNFIESGRSVAELHSLLDFQERLMKSQAEIDFNQAMTRVQIAMPRITKNGEIKNKSGQVVARYMKYEDIDDVLRPMMAQEGFALQHDCREQNGRMLITTTLRHRAGHKESVAISLPYDQPNNLKNAVQAGVSTASYGKRTNVCSLFNIVGEDEDDDGMKSEAVSISEEQAAHIKTRLAENNASPNEIKTFLDLVGADSVDEIALQNHEKAVMALDVWEKRKAAARAAREGGAE